NRCILGGFICAVGKDVPPAKDDVFELFERNEFLDRGCAPFGPFSQADRPELRQRSHRKGLLAAHKFHTRHEGSRHRAHADGQHSEFSLRQSNARGLAHSSFSRLPEVCETVKLCRCFAYAAMNPRTPARKQRILRECAKICNVETRMPKGGKSQPELRDWPFAQFPAGGA